MEQPQSCNQLVACLKIASTNTWSGTTKITFRLANPLISSLPPLPSAPPPLTIQATVLVDLPEPVGKGKCPCPGLITGNCFFLPQRLSSLKSGKQNQFSSI